MTTMDGNIMDMVIMAGDITVITTNTIILGHK
jgi:hypothetical protein